MLHVHFLFIFFLKKVGAIWGCRLALWLTRGTHPKETFKSGKTLTYDWRLSQLKAMETMLVNEKERIAGALAADALALWMHPGRLTWNLQITHLVWKMIFQTSMIMFHVNLQGCSSSWFDNLALKDSHNMTRTFRVVKHYTLLSITRKDWLFVFGGINHSWLWRGNNNISMYTYTVDAFYYHIM